MYNISKSYVKLLGNALGYEYSSSEESADEDFVYGDTLDVKLVYEWLSKVTIESGNPDLGLKALRNTHPAMLGVLGYAVMSCETLGHALERLVNYHFLISSGSLLKLKLYNETFKIEGVEIGCQAPRVYIDSGVSVFLALIKWLVPYKSIKPLAVELVYPKPDSLDLLKAAFGSEIKFSSSSNSLTFHKEIYYYPLVTASSKLNKVHTEMLKAELKSSFYGGVAERVKSIILEELSIGSISSLKSTSRSLKISARSLQYALSNEGVTFRAIFADARKELAHDLIRNTSYNFKYVCATLGFCDRSSFHKSSLRWFGMTPQQYRASIE